MNGSNTDLLDFAISRIRRAIEMADQARNDLGRDEGARETAVAITNAETAILWLEKAIKTIG